MCFRSFWRWSLQHFIAQITSQLDPLDILQLSRVSKHFRSTFASQGSRHIWVAARCFLSAHNRVYDLCLTRAVNCRKNISGMPDCPQDLSEPQYASLMFEHNCQVSPFLHSDFKHHGSTRWIGLWQASCIQDRLFIESQVLRSMFQRKVSLPDTHV